MAGTLQRGLTAPLRWVVGAQVVSSAGTQVTALALPTLAILVLHASPLVAAGLFATEYLANAVSAPAAGVVVRPVRLLAGAALAQAAVVATVPLAALAGMVTIPHLYAVAALAGCLGGLADVALVVLTPRLTTGDTLVRANAALSASRAAGGIGGPALAGVLIAVLGPAPAMAVDTVALLACGILLSRLRLVGASTVDHRSARWLSQLAGGVAVVRAHRLLFRLTLAGGALNLGGAGLGALYVVYCYGTLGLSPAEVGLTFAVFGLATLAGISATPALDRRVETGRLVRVAGPVAAAALLLIPAASLGHPVAVLVAYQLIFGSSAAAWAIAVTTLQQREVPPERLGVVLALTRALGIAAIPVGALGGGMLAVHIGVLPVLTAAATLALTGTGLTLAWRPR